MVKGMKSPVYTMYGFCRQHSAIYSRSMEQQKTCQIFGTTIAHPPLDKDYEEAKAAGEKIWK
jgi:hypothetical protein